MAMVVRGFFIFFASACALAAGKSHPYDPVEALKFAQLSVAAYCGYPNQDDETLETWQCGPACDGLPGMESVRAMVSPSRLDNAFGFVGKLDGVCAVSFRGTTNLPGWIMNLESAVHANTNHHGVNCSYNGKPCLVGHGWMQNYQNLQELVMGNLSEIGCNPGSPIIVTGHSLGAAIAAIAMYDLKNHGYDVLQSYVFGMPRVGDSTFVSAFDAAFGKGHLMRVTHYYDPVPRLPPAALGYTHLPTEVYYESKWSDGYTVCDGSGEDSSCGEDQWWNVPLMISYCVAGQITSGDCDHLTYMEGVLPYRMDGESCTSSVASASTEVMV